MIRNACLKLVSVAGTMEFIHIEITGTHIWVYEMKSTSEQHIVCMWSCVTLGYIILNYCEI